MLGAEGGDAERGVPEQEEDERDHAGFEQPDGDGAQAAEHAVIAPDVPEQQRGGGQDGDEEQPERPGGQEDEFALVKDADRVFEENFKH